jgi:hypothetical protein
VPFLAGSWSPSAFHKEEDRLRYRMGMSSAKIVKGGHLQMKCGGCMVVSVVVATHDTKDKMTGQSGTSGSLYAVVGPPNGGTSQSIARPTKSSSGGQLAKEGRSQWRAPGGNSLKTSSRKVGGPGMPSPMTTRLTLRQELPVYQRGLNSITTGRSRKISGTRCSSRPPW